MCKKKIGTFWHASRDCQKDGCKNHYCLNHEEKLSLCNRCEEMFCSEHINKEKHICIKENYQRFLLENQDGEKNMVNENEELNIIDTGKNIYSVILSCDNCTYVNKIEIPVGKRVIDFLFENNICQNCNCKIYDDEANKFRIKNLDNGGQ